MKFIFTNRENQPPKISHEEVEEYGFKSCTGHQLTGAALHPKSRLIWAESVEDVCFGAVELY